jgi:hypothetical protein
VSEHYVINFEPGLWGVCYRDAKGRLLTIAECFEVETAERIATALNAAGVVDDEAAVERAARAIYAECWPLSGDAPFDSACASERESAYKLARAALAAVKEKDRG